MEENKDYKEPIRRMTTAEFETYAKLRLYSAGYAKQPENVQLVWLAYVLGNIKALFIVMVDGKPDSNYYEATYRAETNDIWIDIYSKKDQIRNQASHE